MTVRALMVKGENCTGCRMCELACSSIKEGEFIPDGARIHVITDGLGGWSRPAICLQCDDPMCLAVCPTGAISRTRTPQGDPVVVIDRDSCDGCHRCVAACPFGAVAFFKGTRAVKCDLCGGSPKCVEFCFYDCLHFVELTPEEFDKRSGKVRALTLKACREAAGRDIFPRREYTAVNASRDLASTLPTLEK